MIIIFCGLDTVASRVKWRAARARWRKQCTTLITLDADSATVGALEELAASRPLDGGKILILGDRVAENIEVKKFLEVQISVLAQSANVFLFLEYGLGKWENIVKGSGGEVSVSGKVQPRARQDVELFALTDALGGRNRRQLWLLFVDALARGVSVEEIYWKLIWKVKKLFLARAGGAEALANIHPFAKKRLLIETQNFTPNELESLWQQLIVCLSKSRQGRDLETQLELLIISL